MKKTALISDIHSNLAALTAVFADIDKRGVKDILCLGDIVGYGPQPRECVDLVIERGIPTIMGNHDHAVLYEPTNFNTGAERACYWTRSCLDDEPDRQKRSNRWNFIGKLPVRLQIDNIMLVHGSPRKSINEYIFPDDIYTNPPKISAVFERVKHLCFVGHTHVPGVFLEDPDFYSIEELDYAYQINENEKAIINVGSVGQPRDQDIRACYTIIEENKVEFIRVEYEVEQTINMILSNPELEKFAAERLRDGR